MWVNRYQKNGSLPRILPARGVAAASSERLADVTVKVTKTPAVAPATKQDNRRYDRERDKRRGDDADSVKSVFAPEPPRWKKFKEKQREPGWNNESARLSDLGDFSDYLLAEPKIGNGAATLLSGAKSYLARRHNLLVNQKDYNSMWKRCDVLARAGAGASEQALPVTAEDFVGLDKLQTALGLLLIYAGIRTTNARKFEQMTIKGDFLHFSVLQQTKKGIVHAGRMKLFSGAKDAVAWMNAASDEEKDDKVDEIINALNARRSHSKVTENSFRVTLATMVRIEHEKKGGDLFELCGRMGRHQGWALPKKKLNYASHSFLTYSRNWDHLQDLAWVDFAPVRHLV
jgi:hypothetical protein